jgi:hypothetical protein
MCSTRICKKCTIFSDCRIVNYSDVWNAGLDLFFLRTSIRYRLSNLTCDMPLNLFTCIDHYFSFFVQEERIISFLSSFSMFVYNIGKKFMNDNFNERRGQMHSWIESLINRQTNRKFNLSSTSKLDYESDLRNLD